MKFECISNVKIIDKNEPRSWSFDGRNGVTYSIAVQSTCFGKWTADENLKVPENIYNSVLVGEEYVFNCIYDSSNNRFSFSSVVSVD